MMPEKYVLCPTIPNLNNTSMTRAMCFIHETNNEIVVGKRSWWFGCRQVCGKTPHVDC